MTAPEFALELKDILFAYRLGRQRVPVLNGLSLSVRRGEMVAIQGPSGSGKSTLLYLLGCMLKPDAGEVRILGEDVGALDDRNLAYLRNRGLGFVFQHFHLLPSANVLENILLPTHYPLEVPGADGGNFEARARALAEGLGLGGRLDHATHQLSGGQQQRVAIARALMRDPPVLLADEPTGNLDSRTSEEILAQLRALNRDGKTLVIITHDPEVAAKCDRVIWVRDGRVQNPETPAPTVPAVLPARPNFRALNVGTLIAESVPRAFANLRRNRVRSALTMLGVVVGVASLIAMLTLGTFTKERILDSYASLGVNTLNFTANRNWNMKAAEQPRVSFNGLEMERDVRPLLAIFPEIRRLSPDYASYNQSAIFAGRSIENEVSLVGLGAEGLAIMRRGLKAGAPIAPFHVKNRSSVCVIGSEVAERLFPRENPIRRTIQLATSESAFSCRVIGVSQPVKSNKDSRFRADLQVILPYTTYLSLPIVGYYRMLRSVLLEVDPRADVEVVGRKVQALFEKRYGVSGKFTASSDSVLLAQMKRFLDLFTLLLVTIATLSLIVGGIGVTNMMLVSVNERFREIGLRKALGATHAAIRQLFLAEALILCGLAGLIGMVLGFSAYEALIYIGAQVIPDVRFEWVFNPLAALISFAAILLTGVLSGLGPALRAEKLQVIEALRSE